MDDLDDLGGDVFVDVVWDWDAVGAVAAEFYCSINSLEERLRINSRNNEISLINSLRTLGAGADADGRERMSHRGEEGRFLRKGAAVADYCEGIHLQAIIVVESERLVLNDAWVQLEARSGETVTAARMATIEDRHIILLSHSVDSIKEAEEVLFSIDILFAVGAEQDVLSFL